MANPQTKDGYTKIANELLDALIAADWSGQDFKIALLIIRKTYGFNKCEDAVSLTQMSKATGIMKIRCSQVVNRLQLMNILTVTENINGIGKKYKFNKDFEKWDTVNEYINRYKKTKQTVNVLRNRPLMKSVTTKETITKETIQKKVRRVFVKPTLEEVSVYCNERRNNIDPEEWLHHYESNGWMVGRNKMQDWKSSIITWERKRKNGDGNNIGNISRPWLRQPGQELSNDAQAALDDVKRWERERSARLASAAKTVENATGNNG